MFSKAVMTSLCYNILRDAS